VGAGIFLHGRLHHGADWNAGEIGYMGVNGGPREPLQVRSTGQLERAIGGQGIEREWLRLLARDRRANDASLAKLPAPEIFDLAAEGDRLAGEVVQYAAGILANCISNLALVLDPELVILGGGVGAHGELCRVTQRILERNEFAQTRLRSSSLGTQAQLHGAIYLSLAASEVRLLA
jgi:glucokinase